MPETLIAGQTYGRLTAVRIVEKGRRRRHERWLFRCVDGN